MNFKRIIISRSDSIGDVILTLPVTGVLKKLLPSCEIIFLGKSYTKDIVSSCQFVNQFIEWDSVLKLKPSFRIKFFQNLHADAIIHIFPVKEIAKLAKQANIPLRVGSTGRLYHYLYCNKLIPLTRRRSSLHEAQLNLKLLQPFGSKELYTINEIKENYGFTNRHSLRGEIKQLVQNDKFNLVLHPKSKGSAREWGLTNYFQLINILPGEKFRIFITGTQEEGALIKKDLIEMHPNIIDLAGKLSLIDLIGFINEADGIVAASTGPLHIAAALGKHAVGLYPPIKPMHPGRWGPIGKKAEYLVLDKNCSKCRTNHHCECLEGIKPETVKNTILNWLND